MNPSSRPAVGVFLALLALFSTASYGHARRVSLEGLGSGGEWDLGIDDRRWRSRWNPTIPGVRIQDEPQDVRCRNLYPAGVPGSGLPRMVVTPGPDLSLQYLRRTGVPGLRYEAEFGSSPDNFPDTGTTPTVSNPSLPNGSGSQSPIPRPQVKQACYGRVRVILDRP